MLQQKMLTWMRLSLLLFLWGLLIGCQRQETVTKHFYYITNHQQRPINLAEKFHQHLAQHYPQYHWEVLEISTPQPLQLSKLMEGKQGIFFLDLVGEVDYATIQKTLQKKGHSYGVILGKAPALELLQQANNRLIFVGFSDHQKMHMLPSILDHHLVKGDLNRDGVVTHLDLQPNTTVDYRYHQMTMAMEKLNGFKIHGINYEGDFRSIWQKRQEDVEVLTVAQPQLLPEVLSTIRKIGKEVLLVGLDEHPSFRQAVEQGEMFATIYPDYQQQVESAFSLVESLFSGQQPDYWHSLKYSVYFRENK